MFLRLGCGAADLDLALAGVLLFKREKLVKTSRIYTETIGKEKMTRKEERGRGKGTCEISFENRTDSFVNFDAAVWEEPENRYGKI